ncbi:DUF1707 SHOCT-like domain-containing protein [Allonocardiopsis opalescens]|uniref:Uncharacterized protein DUF1707 n=1 Tax=Allonocardiopsis opalescens TaxID=1144618 RepID=A0A2T0QD87_9ACTN|nr:DUF1707 domain-containing protein [Allonocardiopsis opalescens]PRY01916.1 uncharacterized protein DUF1707 [Allonocardiopsis opalescens]
MSQPLPPRDLRASDADREGVRELLDAAAADGRLDLDEHAARSERAARARTLGELAAITADLAPENAQPVRIAHGPVIALGRPQERDGRWVVGERELAVAAFSNARLDLTDALLQERRVVVTAAALAGTVHITVPDGVEVRLTGGWSFLGSRGRPPRRPPRPDAPVVEIVGYTVLGSIRVHTPKRPRRRFGRRG